MKINPQIYKHVMAILALAGLVQRSRPAIHHACLFIPLIVLAGCGKNPVSSLSIGSNNWIGYQPLYVARELHYYSAPTIRLVELNNATDVMHELRVGQIDGAALTLDETLTLLEQSIDIQVVLVLDISNGGDVLLAKPGIESLHQLQGKRVAVEYTAVGATMLDAALSSVGMTSDDVEIISCTWDRHTECYEENDAVVTFEPVKTQLINQGAKQLYDSSKIKGRIVDVLVIRTDAIADKPHEIRQLLNGYFKALEYIRKEPKSASQVIQQRTGLGTDAVDSMLAGIEIPGLIGNREIFNKNQLQDNTIDLVNLMVEKELLEQPVSIENLFNKRFLPR